MFPAVVSLLTLSSLRENLYSHVKWYTQITGIWKSFLNLNKEQSLSKRIICTLELYKYTVAYF